MNWSERRFFLAGRDKTIAEDVGLGQHRIVRRRESR